MHPGSIWPSPICAYALEPTASNGFWLQGGASELNPSSFRGLRLMASATGLYAGSDNPALIAPVDMVTIAFGPSYTFHPGHRISLFSEALLGEAYGIHGVFAYGSGATSNPPTASQARPTR